MEPIHIADIAKNKSEIVRVELSEFKGKKLINVRVWYLNEEKEYAPTKKGVALSIDQLAELRNALEKAQEILTTENTPADQLPD